MVQRQQQPIIGATLIIGIAGVLSAAHFTNDLYSPTLFIFKAGLQPMVLLALLSFFIYSLLARKKLIVIATLLATLLSAPSLLPKLGSHSNDTQSARRSHIVVATFSTMTRTDNVDHIVSFANSERPDLLCLQEVSLVHRQALLKRLSQRYPHHLANSNNQLTLSTYPLVLSNDAGHFLVSTLTHPDLGDVEVLNSHMPRPYLSQGIAGKWQQLLNWLDSQSNTILCGDLNTTPNNSLYDILTYRYNLTDSLKSGYGFTYPNAQRKSALLGPFIRIDYILARGFETRNTRTINASNMSDHRAVITQLNLNPKNLQ